MDRNLHTDDFERLLREKSDEFRMYPSKRIWYSVYNNIHPGRKWPSVVMSIVLITSLLLTGYLNTGEPNRSAAGVGARTISPDLASTRTSFSNYRYQPFLAYEPGISRTSKEQSLTTLEQTNSYAQTLPGSTSNVTTTITGTVLSSNLGPASQPLVNGSAIPVGNNDDRIAKNSTQEYGPVILKIDPIELTTGSLKGESEVLNKENSERTSSRVLAMKTMAAEQAGKNNTPDGMMATDNFDKKASQGKPQPPVPSKAYIPTQEEKDWIENYAMYHKPLPKKWAGKLAWQMYATPSVVYRDLKTDPNFGATSNSAPFVIPVNNQDINSQVTQKPSIGLEVGAGFQYPIFKKLRVKAGLQLNFTRYNSHAFHNTHPVATKLTMHDYATNSTYELFRTTPYSNKTGLTGVKLHNETYQVSLPVGLDFRLAGNETLQWNIGVTIQPTYVVGGKSYLISSDRRNYVKETSMLNKWNMNAGFETFLSYKANGLTYQIGPQFRAQLFTTNIKQFAVEERLQAYGIKFGIMKTLK